MPKESFSLKDLKLSEIKDEAAVAFLKRVLKRVSKYTDMGIADLVSRFKRDELLKDQINLSALNVFLAVFAGKAEGNHVRVQGIRKTRIAKYFVEEKQAEEKVTDRLAEAKAESRARKWRSKEAMAHEKTAVFTNVLHRVNKLLDAIEVAVRSLDSEIRRTVK